MILLEYPCIVIGLSKKITSFEIGMMESFDHYNSYNSSLCSSCNIESLGKCFVYAFLFMLGKMMNLLYDQPDQESRVCEYFLLRY